ncbi:MAG TPA: Hsp20/alpha crystallin family protein [Thermoanaerobaculia bacterium]
MTLLTKFERWDPFEELNALRGRMDRLFARMNPPEEATLANWVPLSDIVETKDELVIKAELPGLDDKDIQVEIENGVLAISGKREAETEVDEKGYHRVERSYGSFYRAFTLPPNVEPEKIGAKFDKGLLEVHIPKKESAKPRTIKVDVKKQLASAA